MLGKSKIRHTIYGPDKYNLETTKVSFPDRENLQLAYKKEKA